MILKLFLKGDLYIYDVSSYETLDEILFWASEYFCGPRKRVLHSVVQHMHCSSLKAHPLYSITLIL